MMDGVSRKESGKKLPPTERGQENRGERRKNEQTVK